MSTDKFTKDKIVAVPLLVLIVGFIMWLTAISVWTIETRTAQSIILSILEKAPWYNERETHARNSGDR